MPVKSRIVNSTLKAQIPYLQAAAFKYLDGRGASLIKRGLYDRLYANKNADGTPRPQSGFVSQAALKKSKTSTIDFMAGPGEKAPATLREYRKHGWSEAYLVRTGASTELRHTTKTPGEKVVLTIWPKGQKILSYHMPQSKWRGPIRWLEISENEDRKLVKEVSKDCEKALKRMK